MGKGLWGVRWERERGISIMGEGGERGEVSMHNEEGSGVWESGEDS